MRVELNDVRALAILTTSVVGGEREIPAMVLPGSRPTISTGRSMTDTGGTQRYAGPHCRDDSGRELVRADTCHTYNNLCGEG